VDFRLYAKVLWRFRVIVAIGFVIATALATLSIVHIGPSGIGYRSPELWSSTTRVGVTQKGFPWGRLFAQEPQTAGAAVETPAQQAARLGIPVADPNRLNNLAVLYAELATSDPVRALMRRDGPVRGQIIATPLVVGDNRIMLPLIDLTAISTSRRGAIALAERTATALDTFVRQQQAENEVPAADRVIVEAVLPPRKAQIFQPRSKTMPVVVFMAVLLATFGLSFLLENLRPRARAVEEPAETAFAGSVRRTA
jgi:hypothetical protein